MIRPIIESHFGQSAILRHDTASISGSHYVHHSLPVPRLREMIQNPPINYKQSADLDKILLKLKLLLDASRIDYSAYSLDNIFIWTSNQNGGSFEKQWIKTIIELTSSMPVNDLFPLLDLVRLLLLNEESRESLIIFMYGGLGVAAVLDGTCLQFLDGQSATVLTINLGPYAT